MKKSKLTTAVQFRQLDIAAIKENLVNSTVDLSKQVLAAMEGRDEDKLVELVERFGGDTIQGVIDELVEVGLLKTRKGA
tara:strand:- start:1081 stop:1317 length:237 start_codon:yes stop_codon:yes gene_type:complete